MPTLVPSEIAQYRAGALARATHAETAARADRAAIVAALRVIAPDLERAFGIRRLVLFGSIARGDAQVGRSDVDVLVYGLAAEDEGRAWSLLMDALPGRVVDLVRAEGARERVRLRAEDEGVVVHG
jgi:predicted nucleotidyltransferase